jgi:hypothetical protein
LNKRFWFIRMYLLDPQYDQKLLNCWRIWDSETAICNFVIISFLLSFQAHVPLESSTQFTTARLASVQCRVAPEGVSAQLHECALTS